MSHLGDFRSPRVPVHRSTALRRRAQLLLARLFSRPANVLVLDEPTNDLDIETLELLESLLQEYEGTLFLVSHDREFLDNVVTQTIASEGGGEWKEYAGGYSDWQQARRFSSPRGEQAAMKAASRPAARAAQPAATKLAGRQARAAGIASSWRRWNASSAISPRSWPIRRFTASAAERLSGCNCAMTKSNSSSRRASRAGKSWSRCRKLHPRPTAKAA
jgi:ATPase subunit of ABC transporter with duplicated ATPase domains